MNRRPPRSTRTDTLFPYTTLFRSPYLGPIDNTPAGRTVSLVDFDAPDLVAHPRFAEAMAQARTVELDPGDAVFIPSMWWHHRSEEHTSELQSLMRISYAVFCLKKKNKHPA